ncbi:MAG: ParB/RepB/Spo0J family partition protein [Nitrospirae bacterium]|nr:ParB/RepB/Spo0J family partition protein [Nitrospirota bacterium]
MKNALGKGLGALIPEKNSGVLEIDIERIIPNINQPRKFFDDTALNELAVSIKEQGVIQPILVQRNGDGSFGIIAGERRWRASGIAGLSKVPCIVKESDQAGLLMISLIENIQREDLNPIETAVAYNMLSEEFDLKQEEVAQKVGKDRATVSNYIRLLKLPEQIRSLIKDTRLSMGHAKAIMSIEDQGRQIEIGKLVVASGLSVRETERLCKQSLIPSKSINPKKVDPNIVSIEDELKDHLGTIVRVKENSGKGSIEILFSSIDELNRLLEILKG